MSDKNQQNGSLIFFYILVFILFAILTYIIGKLFISIYKFYIQKKHIDNIKQLNTNNLNDNLI